MGTVDWFRPISGRLISNISFCQMKFKNIKKQLNLK